MCSLVPQMQEYQVGQCNGHCSVDLAAVHIAAMPQGQKHNLTPQNSFDPFFAVDHQHKDARYLLRSIALHRDNTRDISRPNGPNAPSPSADQADD